MVGHKNLQLAAWTLVASLCTTASFAEARSFAGRGQQASALFSLDEGLMIFKLKHAGTGYFSAVLLDQDGNHIALLASKTGPFDGSKAVRVPHAGLYLINVSANDQWTINCMPPVVSGKEIIPVQ